jgi:hypothetical protein
MREATVGLGAAELLGKFYVGALFEDPHPGSLALADPPRAFAGEGKESASFTICDNPAHMGRDKKVPAIVKSGCAKNPISQTRSTLILLSSRIGKNISLKATGKSRLEPRPSRPREGRWPSSRTLGGMRWTLCVP